MKIGIVGIGGVGGYFGGLLAKRYAGGKDHSVVFVARGEHLKQIQTNGLMLETTKGNMTVRPDLATDNPDDYGLFDLILFCVKGYDLEESANLLRPGIGDHTIALSLLNGVNNVEKLQAALKHNQVLDGCVYISSHVARPGVVKQVSGSCKLFFGGASSGDTDWESVLDIFQGAEIDADYRIDIASVIWEKYLFIAPFASATSYLGQSMGAVADSAEGKTLLESLLDEVLAVANALGVQLPDNIREDTLAKGYQFPRETKTSMQLDFEKGKPAELETFTGFVVKTGRARKVPVPYHEKVYEALRNRK